MTTPEPKMIEAAERIARFMETLDDAALENAFAESNVTIIENFPPYIFVGPGAVAEWSRGFRARAAGLSNLRHAFGPPQDFSVDGERAFFTLPTTWTGATDGNGFREDGGWAFALIRENDDWRVQGYGWAVTDYRLV